MGAQPGGDPFDGGGARPGEVASRRVIQPELRLLEIGVQAADGHRGFVHPCPEPGRFGAAHPARREQREEVSRRLFQRSDGLTELTEAHFAVLEELTPKRVSYSSEPSV